MVDQTGNTHSRRGLYVAAWTLLFVAMSLAGAYFGYRSGYDRGYAGGAEPWVGKPLEERTYEVADIAVFQPGSAPDLEIVVDLVGGIHAGSWNDLGGPGSVKAISPTEIKINQTAEIHEIVSQVFQDIRAGRQRQ